MGTRRPNRLQQQKAIGEEEGTTTNGEEEEEEEEEDIANDDSLAGQTEADEVDGAGEGQQADGEEEEGNEDDGQQRNESGNGEAQGEESAQQAEADWAMHLRSGRKHSIQTTEEDAAGAAAKGTTRKTTPMTTATKVTAQMKESEGMERLEFVELVCQHYALLSNPRAKQEAKDAVWQGILAECQRRKHAWAKDKDVFYLRRNKWPTIKKSALRRKRSRKPSADQQIAELDKLVLSFVLDQGKKQEEENGTGGEEEENEEDQTGEDSPPQPSGTKKSGQKRRASRRGGGGKKRKTGQRAEKPVRKGEEEKDGDGVRTRRRPVPQSGDDSPVRSPPKKAKTELAATLAQGNGQPRASRRLHSPNAAISEFDRRGGGRQSNTNTYSSAGESAEQPIPIGQMATASGSGPGFSGGQGGGNHPKMDGLEKDLLVARLKVCQSKLLLSEAELNVSRLEHALLAAMLAKKDGGGGGNAKNENV